MKRLLTALLALLLAIAPAWAEGRTVTDMTGREIALDGAVERVVALTAADCEILYALGAGDCLVGRGEYCDYPAEALAVPAVQSGAETNIEQIIALKPQVVFMGTMAQKPEQAAQLESAGIRVVESEATDIAGVYAAIDVIGQVMSRQDEAAALIDGMKAEFAELSDKAAARGDAPRVYFEISPLQYGLWTAGAGTFMDEAARLLGAENIFSDVDGWAAVSEEQVIQRNPGAIVSITMYSGEGPTPEEELLSRAGWEQVEAIEHGRILNLRDESLSRPGPRLVDGVKALYQFLYGQE